ncbi:phosphotransferase [Chachezhania sediminis]|uniref:phosphotransferase n=1 Tax=Chachezhania sediminis TaxID=2599291 RepID=UPI00131D3F9C|nr:phosphotransferase [Chachezhania sediminis]
MSDRESQAKAFAETALGAPPTTFVNPLTVLASPAWRGVEGDIWRAGAGDATAIVKHYHPDTAFYVDAAKAIAAARHAGETGAGPAVLADDADSGLVAFEILPAPWRCAGLQDPVVPKLRAATIAAKKAFQSGPALGFSASIFDEIDSLAAMAEKLKAPTHPHLATFLSVIGDAGARIRAADRDLKPCHRDGNTANLMIGPDVQVKLVDFDLAADTDPYEDIGCWLMEFFDCEPEARTGFEEWEGRFDEGLFQRAMLYGMADDLRWGLIGSVMAVTSPRKALEFAKYASWRFLRLSTMALGSQASDRLRRAA